jgi:hypothetical protein
MVQMIPWRRKRPPSWWERFSLPSALVGTALVSGGAGALLSHLFDPDRGRARRARLHDRTAGRLRRQAHRTTRALGRQVRYTEGRLEGARHAVATRIRPDHHDRPDDATLVQRVRSQVLGRPEFGATHINVDACQGVIHLRGELSSPETIDRLERSVQNVADVVRVESYLHLAGQPAPNKEPVLNRH